MGFLKSVHLWERESAKLISQNEDAVAQVEACINNERVQDLEEVF